MKFRLVLLGCAGVALGLLAAAATRPAVTPDAAKVDAAAPAARAGEADGSRPRATSERAGRVLAATDGAGVSTRRVYDLAPVSTSKRDPIPHETTRDEAWAAPMERAIEQFTRRRLEEFIPSLRWDGARCMTTTCVISYRVPASEWKLARYLHSVALGPSTYRTNHLSDAGDGMTRVDLLVSYVDPRSEVLVSADEYLSSRAKYNSHYEKVKANLDQLKAELARDP